VKRKGILDRARGLRRLWRDQGDGNHIISLGYFSTLYLAPTPPFVSSGPYVARYKTPFGPPCRSNLGFREIRQLRRGSSSDCRVSSTFSGVLGTSERCNWNLGRFQISLHDFVETGLDTACACHGQIARIRSSVPNLSLGASFPPRLGQIVTCRCRDKVPKDWACG
jgi:hypothetical protein